jgi:glycosyltransferase involved in cell wall biosynthesis
MPQLSVVVPVYNEAPNAEALVAELRATLDKLTLTSEVVLVDDGSTDETFALLAAACAADPRFRIVRLRRNFGQTAALAAGLDHCSGAIVVTMDGDLQNDPADIPRLVAELGDSYDVVAGRPTYRSRHSKSRRNHRSQLGFLWCRIGDKVKHGLCDNPSLFKLWRSHLEARHGHNPRQRVDSIEKQGCGMVAARDLYVHRHPNKEFRWILALGTRFPQFNVESKANPQV